MRTLLTLVLLMTLLGCSDILVEQTTISSEPSWTTTFENQKGQFRPLDNYSKTFTLQPKSDGSSFRTVCLPIEKRQVYVCTSGTDVRVVSDGVVKGVFTLLGKTGIVVGHGDYHTVYINMDKALFREGDTVARGMTIGMIATDNIETEFLFEIYKHRDKLQPADWILNAP